ncbi:MAG: lipid-A-disaccharide synthase [Rikenellaceae bacterium]
MRYFLIAGEPSGDLHGSNLMRGLLESDPEAEFRFWGGDKMAEVGGVENLGLHYRESSFFGLFQVIFNLRTILRQIKLCQSQIEAFQPDVVILIDYAGFNLKIAKFAKERAIKTFFYIAPKVWAWDESRIKRIKRYVDELFIIFPFEQEYFRKRGIEAHFEGNPLVDAIATRCRELPSKARFISKNGLSERPIVALLSGSRASEIKANLPLMRRVADEFVDYQFVVAGVDWLDRKEYDKWLAGSDIKFVEGQTYELLKHSVAAIVTSGTATLETALIGTPQVVVFRLPWLHVTLRPLVLKIPFISLVNINLQREAVKEILQSSLDPTAIVSALREILPNGEGRAKMLADYDELSNIIGEEDASRRFAERMVKLLNNISVR